MIDNIIPTPRCSLVAMRDNPSEETGSDSVNRRRVLQALGAGAMATSFSTVGAASTSRSVPEGDVEITGTTAISPDGVGDDIQAVTDQKETNQLSTHIEDETGFQLESEFAVGIELETDDPELNSHEPRVLHLPLKPSTEDDGLKAHSTDQKSEREFTIDNGGALMAVTIEESGERQLAGLMGVTREESRDEEVGALRESEQKKVNTKSFVVEDGSATVHRESTDRKSLKSDWENELNKSDAPITPQDTQFTCWGCATVVGIACAGAATLSYSTCVSAAFASSVFSPTAGAAVAAFCTYIVTNAGTLSCAAGVGAICAGVTGDCNFLED